MPNDADATDWSAGDAYQLSPAQRVWANAEPAVRCLTLRFGQPLDRAVLARALLTTGRSFEALRTRFPARPGMVLPVQVIDPAPLPWLDMALAELDAARGPVVGASLTADGCELSLRALAVALDRRSLILWARAIGRACHGLPLNDTIQPSDAAEGLAALAEDKTAAPAHDYWRTMLALGEPAGRLAEEAQANGGRLATLDRPWGDRPKGNHPWGDTNPPLAARALALWHAWLSRETGLAQVTIGVQVSGRDAELEDALGNYARSVPCTLRIGREGRLAAAEAAAATLLERAERWMLLAPDPDGPATERVGGLRVFPYGFRDETIDPAIDWDAAIARLDGAELPCRLHLTLLPGGFRLGYDSGRFTAAAATRMADRFATFAAAAMADPASSFARLPTLPAAEAVAVQRVSQGPALASDAAASILDRIAAAVAAGPGRLALTDPAGSRTYGEFWEDSSRIAAGLAAEGVGRGARVALVARRSARTITALIGILRAGAIAVPIDPAYPAARQALLIENVASALVLTDVALGALPLSAECRMVTIDEAMARSSGSIDPPAPPARTDGAYILHTSGSTGCPKGVLVDHGNLLASTLARFAYYANAPSAFLLTPSLSFDSSVAGLYWTLAAGGRLVLPAPGEERDPSVLAGLIARERVSHWLTVPALYQAVLTAAGAEELTPLTDVIVAGEACVLALVASHAALAPHVRLHNEYGPTETTVWCTCWSWSKTGSRVPDPVPIGTPIPGAAVYLLDEHGALVPDGALGEIHVGGVGVAAGYIGQPAATAAAFRPDPFGPVPSSRIYATGDLGRRRPDGVILYAGRVDRQLKIRGRRIEPREIEAALDALPGVARSVVLLREDRPRQDLPGEHRLVAYLQRQPGATLCATGTREALKAVLPEWLVPGAIVVLDVFPTGPNGKLDTDALPAPEWAARAAYRAPAEPAEQALAAAVAAVVGVTDPGLDDDFFALGGDSLMALQVAARLRGTGFSLSVRSIFATPRLGDLSGLMRPAGEAATASTAHDEDPAPLTPIQRWFLTRDLPDPRHYNQAVAFEVDGGLTLDRLKAALTGLIGHHPALRSVIEPHADGWRQRPLPASPNAPGWFDLRALPAALKDRVLSQKIEELQRGVDPFGGQMLRAAGFRLGAGRPDLLVLVAHHLVVDAQSWHVLAEDFAAAYLGQPLAPTVNYGQWARALAERATLATGKHGPWCAYLADADGRLPRDRPHGTTDGTNREADAAEIVVTLPATQGRALARRSSGRPGCGLSDALLAALALVLGDWTGHPRMIIDVEGSGRNVPADLPDPSRTIGWLTTLAPLVLPHRPGDTREAGLRAAVDAISAAPADWTYALGDPRGPHSSAEFCVNFLGGLADDTMVDGRLRPVPLDLGRTRGAANPRAHLIELEAETVTKGLRILWRYPTTLFDASTINRLANRHLDLLADLAGAAS